MPELEEIEELPEPHPSIMEVAYSEDNWKGPQTHDEAQAYHQGFVAGLTAFAMESGYSTIRSREELLRKLKDEQGWKTLDTFEQISAKRNALEFSELDGARCEHGIPEGDFCEDCRQDYHIAANDPENGVVEL